MFFFITLPKLFLSNILKFVNIIIIIFIVIRIVYIKNSEAALFCTSSKVVVTLEEYEQIKG